MGSSDTAESTECGEQGCVDAPQRNSISMVRPHSEVDIGSNHLYIEVYIQKQERECHCLWHQCTCTAIDSGNCTYSSIKERFKVSFKDIQTILYKIASFFYCHKVKMLGIALLICKIPIGTIKKKLKKKQFQWNDCKHVNLLKDLYNFM